MLLGFLLALREARAVKALSVKLRLRPAHLGVVGENEEVDVALEVRRTLEACQLRIVGQAAEHRIDVADNKALLALRQLNLGKPQGIGLIKRLTVDQGRGQNAVDKTQLEGGKARLM